MTSQDLRRINQALSIGELPPEFNFTNSMNDNIDWDKVRYNAFYKSADYFLSKFPTGFQNIPQADKIIESMIENVKTPLEEMHEREQESINKIWEETIKNLSVEDIDINECEDKST